MNIEQLQFFKDIYDKEIERRSLLNNDLSLPVGVISVLCTVLFYFLSTFDYSTNTLNSIFFVVTSAIGIVFLMLGIYYLIHSYDSHPWAKHYRYIGYPDEIKKYYSDYKNYLIAIETPQQEIAEKADIEFQEYLLEAYIRASRSNMEKNDVRSGALHKSKSKILFSLVMLIFAFIPYLVNNFTKREKIPKVEISGLSPSNPRFFTNSKINVMATENDSTPQPSSNPTIVKPTPPNDRQVRGTEGPTPPPKPKPTQSK